MTKPVRVIQIPEGILKALWSEDTDAYFMRDSEHDTTYRIEKGPKDWSPYWGKAMGARCIHANCVTCEIAEERGEA